ncbi:MAG: amino acid dehydrogenase [Colwelliaceae bacterium]|nr:amino acid dehydrogenase [Colwelliaceae bacterium]
MVVNTTSTPQNIAVVGAGIIGVNCALALQLKGHQVTLIDKTGIGEACSKGNAGHFATEQVFPLAQASLLPKLPRMLVDPLGPVAISPKTMFKSLPWFIQFLNNMRPKSAKHVTKALKALNVNAIDYYRPLLEIAGVEHLLTEQGSLLTFESTPIAEIKSTQQTFTGHGVKVDLMTLAQARELEPALKDNITHVLFFPEVGHTIDPQKLCIALAQAAIDRGAKYIQADVLDVQLDDGCSGVVVSRNDAIGNKSRAERISFDKLVLATGAASKSLFKKLGYKLPIQAERGYHCALTHHSLVKRPITSAERKFIMTPMASGLRLAGTVEYADIDAPANYKRADSLYINAQAIVENLPEKQSSPNWMGCRPSLPDSLPVISRATHHNNLFLAVGHHHLGLTQGAITGKLISQLVDNEPTDIDVSPFDIRRFN